MANETTTMVEAAQLVERAWELLDQVPDDYLIFALRKHPAVQRIIAGEKNASVTLGRNASGGWSFEVKAYAADAGEALSRASAVATTADQAYNVPLKFPK